MAFDWEKNLGTADVKYDRKGNMWASGSAYWNESDDPEAVEFRRTGMHTGQDTPEARAFLGMIGNNNRMLSSAPSNNPYERLGSDSAYRQQVFDRAFAPSAGVQQNDYFDVNKYQGDYNSMFEAIADKYLREAGVRQWANDRTLGQIGRDLYNTSNIRDARALSRGQTPTQATRRDAVGGEEGAGVFTGNTYGGDKFEDILRGIATNTKAAYDVGNAGTDYLNFLNNAGVSSALSNMAGRQLGSAASTFWSDLINRSMNGPSGAKWSDFIRNEYVVPYTTGMPTWHGPPVPASMGGPGIPVVPPAVPATQPVASPVVAPAPAIAPGTFWRGDGPPLPGYEGGAPAAAPTDTSDPFASWPEWGGTLKGIDYTMGDQQLVTVFVARTGRMPNAAELQYMRDRRGFGSED